MNLEEPWRTLKSLQKSYKASKGLQESWRTLEINTQPSRRSHIALQIAWMLWKAGEGFRSFRNLEETWKATGNPRPNPNSKSKTSPKVRSKIQRPHENAAPSDLALTLEELMEKSLRNQTRAWDHRISSRARKALGRRCLLLHLAIDWTLEWGSGI